MLSIWMMLLPLMIVTLILIETVKNWMMLLPLIIVILIMIAMVTMREGHLPKASVISMRKKSAAQTCHKVGDN